MAHVIIFVFCIRRQYYKGGGGYWGKYDIEEDQEVVLILLARGYYHLAWLNAFKLWPFMFLLFSQ